MSIESLKAELWDIRAKQDVLKYQFLKLEELKKTKINELIGLEKKEKENGDKLPSKS